MSDKKRQKPAALAPAREALKILQAEDAALAARMRTLLPGYAVRREQRGEAFDVESLLAAARLGPDALKAIFNDSAAPQSLHDHYRHVLADLNPPRPPQPQHGGYGHFDAEFGNMNHFVINRDAFDPTHMQMHPAPPMHDRLQMMHYLRGPQNDYHLHHVYLRAMHEGTLAEQQEKCLRLLMHASKHNVALLLTTGIQANRFALMQGLLPRALAHMPPEDAERLLHRRLMPAILRKLPHSEGLLDVLIAHKDLWDAPSWRDFFSDLRPDLLSDALLTRILNEAPRDIDNRCLRGFVRTAIKCKPEAARRALHLHRPVQSRDEMGGYLDMLACVLEHGDAAFIRDALKLTKGFDVNWADFFDYYAKNLKAAGIRAAARHADRVQPDWPFKLQVRQLPETLEDIVAYLDCLPQAALEKLMPDLARAACNPYTHETVVAELARRPGFAALPAYETMKIAHDARLRWDKLLPYIDLAALTPAQRGHLMEMNGADVSLLAASGPCPQDILDRMLRRALQGMPNNGDHMRDAYTLARHGADVSRLSVGERDAYDAVKPQFDRWLQVAHCLPPTGLREADPSVFKPALYHQLRDILTQEGYQNHHSNVLAYNGMALFQSPERVVQYLKKWARPGRQPLHNLLQVVQLPRDLGAADLSAWGDAVLRHGPDMARLVKYCHDIPAPAKSEDGAGWSLVKTREIAAQFAYVRGHEHRALAALCHKHNISEATFERALDIVKTTPAHEKNLPDIDIDGAAFGLEGARFRRLANDDIRGLFLGELTDCCQSIGGHGAKCAQHGYTSADGGFYVVETAKGEIIGQTWAWRGEKGELVFDSLEMLSGRVSAEQWRDIVQHVAVELAGGKMPHDVTALHVGASGETPRDFGGWFNRADGHQYRMYNDTGAEPAPVIEAAQPRDYTGYRDSSSQYQIWQKPAVAAPKRQLKMK